MSAAGVDTLVDDDRYELGLVVLVRVLARRWWVIAIILSLSLAMTVQSVRATVPMYQAATDLRINEAQGEWVFGITGVKAQDPVRAMETQQLTILSRPVWDEVEQRLGTQAMGKIAGLEAEILGRADMMRIVVQSADPVFAQEAANAFAHAYVDVRQQQIRDMLGTLGDHLSSQSARYRENLVVVNAEIAERTGISDDIALVGALSNETAENVALLSRLEATNLETDDAELQRLLAEREVILKLTVEMRQRAEQVDIDAAVSTAGAQIVSLASSTEGPLPARLARGASRPGCPGAAGHRTSVGRVGGGTHRGPLDRRHDQHGRVDRRDVGRWCRRRQLAGCDVRDRSSHDDRRSSLSHGGGWCPSTNPARRRGPRGPGRCIVR